MKRFKILITIVVAVCALLLLASCDIKTTITADKNFNGKRVMEVTVSKNEMSSEYVSGTPEKIESVLRDALPEELTMECKKGKNGSYVYLFTMEFESYDEYLTKVTSLLGKEPDIKYNYSGTPFSKGFMLRESFSSGDLLEWAADAIKEAGIFQRFEYANTRYVKTTAIIDGNTINTSDGSHKTVSVSMSQETELRGIEISTVKQDFYSFNRTITYSFPPQAVDFVGKKDFERYMKKLEPKDGKAEINYPAEGSEDDTVKVTVRFTANAEQLGEDTNVALGGKNSVARYTMLEEGLTPFTGRWDLYEYLDLSAWQGVNGNLLGPVALWYKTDDGSRLTKSNVTVGVAEVEGKITNNGRIIEYSDLTEGVLRVNIASDYNFKLDSFKIAVAENNSNRFTKKYTLIYSTTEDAPYGPKYTKEFFKLKGWDKKLSLTADVNSDGLGRLVIEADGNSERVTEAFSEIFGEGNAISQKLSKESRYTLTLENYISDSNNLTDFLKLAGYEGNISYSFRPYVGNRIYNAVITDTAGGIIERKDSEVNNTGKMTAEISAHEFICSYSSLGENTWIIIVFIISAVIIAVGILFVILWDVRSKKSDKNTDK